MSDIIFSTSDVVFLMPDIVFEVFGDAPRQGRKNVIVFICS